ncbi:MAG: TonB-dependent receptor [Bacteroidota bacterium]|nr:TonB-dependent receptor [Bacteroidota bacterium]
MRKKIITLLFVALVCATTVIAQNLNVDGLVVDKKTGDPLIGATIMQKGTSNGTVTDIDGKFAFTMPTGSTLLISYVGYTSQELVIIENITLRILLVSNTANLEEVVVVGYGTARKRDLTGSIVSITGESLKNAPNYNPVDALQGKVPGLMVTNSGEAGTSPTVRLRGVGTINANTNPLYVVDGMFIDNIDFINPNDITSIEVLKDPSSLAIFGVQGANGVIIITTKRADKGKLSVSYDGYVGTQVLLDHDRVKLTNASDFTLLYNEELKNADPNVPDWVPDLLGGGTNWQSHIFRPAMITNHGITISNSSDKASTVLSIGYFKQDGIVKYNDYQRFNGRWAGDYIISKNLKLGGNVNLSRWDETPASASVIDAVRAFPTYSPYSPVEDHNPDNIASYYTPNPNIQKDVPNPVAEMEVKKGNTNNYGYRAVGNVYAEIPFLKDFTFKATGYGDIGLNLGSVFIPQYNINNATSISSFKNEITSFSRSETEYTKYQVDFILNYNKKIATHKINIMAGYTARVQKSLGFSAKADSLESSEHPHIIPDDLKMLVEGSNYGKSNTDWYDAESFISYLGRVNYSYADKYLASITFRMDGSSKFSSNHRWGYFPSVGLGWVITDEDFMSGLKDVLNYMKIKTSWGMLGNDKIGSFLNYPRIYPKGQQVMVNGVTYYLPTYDYLVDKNLHWEVVTGLDAGFESQFFNNRLSLEAGYYTKTTSDLLAYVAVPASVGSGFKVTNAGSLRNSGMEFILSWHDVIGKFSYGASVNGATLKNEVRALGNDNSNIVSDDYHVTSVGHPVGAIYGYVQDGIFQNQTEIANYYAAPWTSKPGDIRYKDLNGDKRITDKDRTFIGSIIPTFTYGFSLNTGYQNFDLSVDFNGVSGNQIINKKKLSSFSQFNFYSTALTRWHGENTSNFEPILDLTRSQNILPSTNLLESGAYLRIRSIQLGYNLPNKILKGIGINKLRVFINSQNPFTFKSNTGYTPEIGGDILTGSIDNGSTYPIPTTFTAGLSVNF